MQSPEWQGFAGGIENMFYPGFCDELKKIYINSEDFAFWFPKVYTWQLFILRQQLFRGGTDRFRLTGTREQRNSGVPARNGAYT